jgi:long-chain acyl-CoA synthetase
MFRNTVMRLICRATQVLPIDQSSYRLANLALGAAVLARGNKLIWFPEGGRSRDGTLQLFQPGIGLLLTAQPIPVVPVRISGSFEALPIGAWWPRRGRIQVVFGEVVDPHAVVGQSEGADRYRQMATALHDRVATLNGRSESDDS